MRGEARRHEVELRAEGAHLGRLLATTRSTRSCEHVGGAAARLGEGAHRHTNPELVSGGALRAAQARDRYHGRSTSCRGSRPTTSQAHVPTPEQLSA
jgi:hypothetical protein